MHWHYLCLSLSHMSRYKYIFKYKLIANVSLAKNEHHNLFNFVLALALSQPELHLQL